MVRTIHGWGYNYFKMDGLWTGTATEQIYVNDGYKDDHIGNNAPFHDPTKTNIEVYRDGLKLLREAAGPERVLLRLQRQPEHAHARRHDRPGRFDAHRPRQRHELGRPRRGPIRGSRLYFLNGRVWWNDPDPCYVRASIPIDACPAHHVMGGDLSGEFNLNSDWLPGLPARAARHPQTHDAGPRRDGSAGRLF